MRFFKLPDLGEGLPEADILTWHVTVGDSVTEDQPLVSVETAKAIIEVPSPCSGQIAALFGQPGDTIHTGEPLVEFANAETEDSGTVVGKLDNTDRQRKDDFIVGAATSSRQAISSGTITPAIRALAQRLSVDVERLAQSQPNVPISTEQVLKSAADAAKFGDLEPLRGVRKQMAITMARSHSEVVPVTLFEDALVDHWTKGTDITLRLIRAIADACETVPELNCWLDGQQQGRRMHQKVDLGIAVDTPQGLFVPVLRNITQRDDKDLRAGLDRLRADVEARTIPASELQGATLTLSNFGSLAGRYATPIVVPPQVAILGAGRVRTEPKVVDGKLVAAKVLPLSLTVDHRAVTGAEAARFLSSLMTTLES